MTRRILPLPQPHTPPRKMFPHFAYENFDAGGAATIEGPIL